MKQGIREFFNSPAGRVAAIGLIIVGLLIAIYSVKSNLGNPLAEVNVGNFICAETGKSFTHTIQLGERLPIYSPYSGKNTGYVAEMCYWTKDGKPRKTPYPVLLNQYKGKTGPTFCPDCGRLVVGLNPPAHLGDKPPPTEEEYKARKTTESAQGEK